MPKGFTQKQLQAAELLARNLSQVKVAAEIGTSRTTIIRWLKQPDFCKKVESLRQKAEQVSTRAFVEVTKERVKCGAITLNETIELLSSVVRDEDCRLSDRLKAAEVLGKWLGWGNGKKYVQPPELPSKPFTHAEMSRKLEVLKSQAVVASQFLIEQAVTNAAQGDDIQVSTSVIAKSVDLADSCTFDLPSAANLLSKQGFIILSPTEYDRLLPEGHKSVPHLLQPLNFDRAFGWRWLKQKSS